MGTSYTGNKTGASYNVTVNRPIDIRTVVDSVEDLTNGSIPYRYTGLVVNIKGTGDLYVLISNVKNSNKPESWVKIGNSSSVNPSDNLPYYQEKLGVKVVDSVDELVSSELESPYVGMSVVVLGDDSESELNDDNGLYILVDTPNTSISNWLKVSGECALFEPDTISDEEILDLF